MSTGYESGLSIPDDRRSDVPPSSQITEATLEGLDALYGECDELGYVGNDLELSTIRAFVAIDLRLLSYLDDVTNLRFTPAQIFEGNFFKEFTTLDYPFDPEDYKIALFRFAYDYFRATDEERAVMKHKVQLSHHAAIKAHEAAERTATKVFHSQLGNTAIES